MENNLNARLGETKICPRLRTKTTMIAFVVSAVIIATTEANSDLCSCTGGIVVCQGSTITSWISSFQQNAFITEIIYDRTLIANLPLLADDEYVNLQSVSFYGNTDLSCDEILNFQRIHQDLIVITNRV